MIKLTILSAILGVATCLPRAYPLTQEQLAQFVAAQQTAAGPSSAPQRLISIVPRARQAYQEPDPAAAYHKPSQAIYQAESAAAYQDDGAADPSAYQQQPVYYQAPARQPKPQQVAYIDPSQYKKYKLPRPSPAGLARDPKQPADDYDPNPQYQFSFDIKDDESTNYHNRKETRDGDKISGSYSVVDSDGFIRTVTYTADPKEGFKADVSRQPTDIVVKLPKHPTPGIAQQYQLAPSSPYTARKQQTQQYLEASSPVDGSSEQQYIPQQQYVPQRPTQALTQAALAAYAANPHRLAPNPAKSAKAYAIPQGATLLYRPAPAAAYHQ
ncbi:cuticle protein [Nilaparvata lugens]|uniref:Cuticular protein n=1 Tax=Nilaparvata lugens TaxID=108931 RepID=A0A2S1ZSB9_NILLU|nr:cuticle protein [Nilaparvata lugens]AWK28356.1 cuticular protein [Nilaparvata lugens]